MNKRLFQTIYKLKRLYGREISLYRQGNSVTNTFTGVVTLSGRTVIDVKRAIVLPVKLVRTQVQTISMISADKQFVQGGMFDQASRWFYIDPKDLPSGYQIERDDHIVYRGKKYEIKTVKDNEFELLWEVLGIELIGVIPEQVINLTGYNIIDFQQTGGVE